MEKELLLRIQHVMLKETDGNETAFAKKIGISQSTLHRNLKAGDNKLLMGLVGWILLAFPEVSRKWLLTGEGEMFGGGGERKPPTPHIDVALLQEVIEALEEHLQAVKGKLSPERKAVVVSQLYELIVEQEEQAREPIQMMRLVMGALAKATNG